MKLYDDKGYVNIETILNYELPFNFIVGGRGTGKTFGALKYVIENNIKFIYQRRTQAQVDMISQDEFNPFKSVNKYCGYDIISEKISQYMGGFYNCIEENGKRKPSGDILGYIVALSTISRIRGFDSSDVEIIIGDEFIPEIHEQRIKNEAMAFLNSYETINRNRELNGEKPVQYLGLANANRLDNDIFLELGLVNIVSKMQENGNEINIDKNRGIGIFLLSNSPVSEYKQDNSLYKLVKHDSEFFRMSLNNEFNDKSTSIIKSQNIKEYRILFTIGEISIYKHKSKNIYYCSTHRSGSAEIYGTSQKEKNRVKKDWYFINRAYLCNNIIFESPICEIIFNKLVYCCK